MNISANPLFVKNSLMLALGFISMPILADGFRLQDANVKSIDKERWQCEYCKPSNALRNSVTLKATHKSNDNGHFSSAAGDKHQGLAATLSSKIVSRNEDNNTQLTAKDIGADNMRLRISTEKAKSYKVTLAYKTLNTFGHDKALTPYVNAGSNNLLLPDGWQFMPSTTNMPIDSFNYFANKLERENWHLMAEKQFTDQWQTYIDFQSENKQGLQTSSGNILTKVVRFPETIDQKHDQFELGSFYQFKQGSILVNYHLSDFSNDYDAMSWQSPYSALFGGAVSGQKSTAPDNQHQQLSLVATYQNNDLNLQSQFIYGQLTQDQQFLPYSNNTLLSAPALNVNNLDGEIKTFNANIRGSYRINKNWRMKLNYRYDDRDNNTPTYVLQHVLSDSVVFDNTFESKAYSYQKEKIDVQSQWRFNPRSKLNVGWSSDQQDRDYQDRDRTENNKFWVKVSTRFDFINHFSMQFSRELRDGSQYQPTDLTSPVSSALRMQKYYLADREREQLKTRFSFMPSDNIDVNIQGYFSRDKYDHTEIGLIESRRRGVDVSSSIQIKENISFSAYIHNQWQDNVSQGSYWFNNVDWQAIQDDKTDTAGISLTARKLADNRLTLSMHYDYSYAKGIASINKFTQDLLEENNELTVNSANIKLNAEYIYSPKINLIFDVVYQQFDEDDWRHEYLANELVSVLGTGVTGFDYDAIRFAAGVAYRF